MHCNLIPIAVLAAALSACSLQPEALNSERITDRYGNYGIEIVRQDGDFRASNLYSTDDGVRTCRTYAVVEFAGSNRADLIDAHNMIVDGASIGATLKDSGWEIRKESFHIGTLRLPEREHPANILMRVKPGVDVAIHAYKLHIEKGPFSAHYATIVEAHHPDYLGISELRDLYPVPSETDVDVVNHIQQLVLGQSRD